MSFTRPTKTYILYDARFVYYFRIKYESKSFECKSNMSLSHNLCFPGCFASAETIEAFYNDVPGLSPSLPLRCLITAFLTPHPPPPSTFLILLIIGHQFIHLSQDYVSLYLVLADTVEIQISVYYCKLIASEYSQRKF